MTDERILIQSFLTNLVKGEDFPQVAYDKNTGLPFLNGKTEKASFLNNEIRCQYDVDRSYGRREVLRKTGWMIQCQVRFNGEVSLSGFEKMLMENPPLVPVEGNSPPTRLHLASMTVDHPVQQQPDVGTRVVLVFTAIPGRI